MLTQPRLRNRTLPPNPYRSCRPSPALPHLSLHDPGALALNCRSGLLSRSTMAAYRCAGKESGFVVDIGSPRNMVD
jgi:hypothetical protein